MNVPARHDGVMSEVDFEQLVQEAVDALPNELRGQIANVEIAVEDEPPPGTSYLGLYQGIPLTRRGAGYGAPLYNAALPDKITIYRGPLLRHYGADPGRLADEVRHVVWHEIAHHFGISDERLIEIDRY
jgi:predicted Zn-dependent protease with MMP-like domain